MLSRDAKVDERGRQKALRIIKLGTRHQDSVGKDLLITLRERETSGHTLDQRTKKSKKKKRNTNSIDNLLEGDVVLEAIAGGLLSREGDGDDGGVEVANGGERGRRKVLGEEGTSQSGVLLESLDQGGVLADLVDSSGGSSDEVRRVGSTEAVSETVESLERREEGECQDNPGRRRRKKKSTWKLTTLDRPVQMPPMEARE